jgi:glutamate racemase
MFTNKEESRDLLLLDWGIGGLSVYNEVKKRRPELGCVYLSDAGVTPYGKMAPAELADRLTALIERAAARFRLSDVIIACNAASTARDTVASRLPGLRITGMIEAGIETVCKEGFSRAGVIGGLRTVEAGVYQAGLGKLGVAVEARPAQPLSALIEAGHLHGPEVEAALKPILEPLRGIPALLLACTHYPAIAGEIQKFLPGTSLLDPALLVAQAADAVGTRRGGQTLFYTSGDCAASERAARLAFGVEAGFAPAEWMR